MKRSLLVLLLAYSAIASLSAQVTYSSLKATAVGYRSPRFQLTESEPLAGLFSVVSPQIFEKQILRPGGGLAFERVWRNRGYLSLGIPYFRRRGEVVTWSGVGGPPPAADPAPVERTELDIALRIEYGRLLAVGERTRLGIGVGTQLFYAEAEDRTRTGPEFAETYRLSGYQLFPTLTAYYDLAKNWQLHAGFDPVVISMGLAYARKQGPTDTVVDQLLDLDLLFGNCPRLGIVYRWGHNEVE